MTITDIDTAINAIRSAALAPTRRRIMIAALAFSGPTVAQSAEELTERAADAGLCLPPDQAEAALSELRGHHILPQVLQPRSAVPDLGMQARLLAGIANPVRLQILTALDGSERAVGWLKTMTGLKPSALSHHLARLRVAGLVKTRREATRIYYSLANSDVAAIIRSLEHAPRVVPSC
jgi:DNA-binding transcriptional ArsR family regulator